MKCEVTRCKCNATGWRVDDGLIVAACDAHSRPFGVADLTAQTLAEHVLGALVEQLHGIQRELGVPNCAVNLRELAGSARWRATFADLYRLAAGDGKRKVSTARGAAAYHRVVALVASCSSHGAVTDRSPLGLTLTLSRAHLALRLGQALTAKELAVIGGVTADYLNDLARAGKLIRVMHGVYQAASAKAWLDSRSNR